MADSEAHTYFERVHDATCEPGRIRPTSSSATPFPFSAGVDVRIFGDEYCSDTSHVQTDANRSCAPDNTRNLDAAVDITFNRTKISEDVTFDYRFWIGVRENPFTGNICYEIGQEASGICFTTCTPSGDPTRAELKDAMEYMMEWANSELMAENIGSAVLQLVVAIFLIVLIALKCTVTGGALCS